MIIFSRPIVVLVLHTLPINIIGIILIVDMENSIDLMISIPANRKI